MKTDNVVPFPRGKKDAPPQSKAEIFQKVLDSKMEYSEIAFQMIVPHIFSAFFSLGIDLLDDDLNKNNAMLLEAVKAVILKSNGIPHPLHAATEKWFTVFGEGDIVRYEYELDADLITKPETDNDNLGLESGDDLQPDDANR